MQRTEGEAYGAWGIFGAHFGQGTTVDVFCSIASTFCRIYEDMIRETEDAVHVDLHFSKDAPAAKVEAERDEQRQAIGVTMKVKKALHVRIPAWCPKESVICTAGIPFGFEGNEMIVPAEAIEEGKKITVSFELPGRESVEETRYSGTKYRLRWKGDSVIWHEEIGKEGA